MGRLAPRAAAQTETKKGGFMSDLNKQIAMLSKIKRSYPLAVSQLWRPHCHRFDGLGSKSPRARGCGRVMRRLSSGVWRCDHCDITEARTAQAEVAISFPSCHAYLVLGGNRAGKSQLGAQLAVAFSAGRREWWVQQWAALNGISLDIIPPEPSTVVSSGLSYNDSVEYIRPKINEYLPAGCTFRNWTGAGRSVVTLPNGGRIMAISADSGREKYQGIGAARGVRQISLIWLDEEHPKAIFDECGLRLSDTSYGGKLLLTMTPLKGLTWAHERFIERNIEGFETIKISGLDNPYVSSVKIRRAVRHLSKEAQESRLYGSFTSQTGLIYSNFKKSIHVTKSHKLPDHFMRIRGIDFGTRNPFCCLWGAYDEDTDTLHIYREYYVTEKTTMEAGNIVNRLSKDDPPIEFTVADPESRDGRLTLARYCNIPTKPAAKHVGLNFSIEYVQRRLLLDAEGRPALVVHDCCQKLIREFRLYRWKPGKETPNKADDHALDALRYMCTSLARMIG